MKMSDGERTITITMSTACRQLRLRTCFGSYGFNTNPSLAHYEDITRARAGLERTELNLVCLLSTSTDGRCVRHIHWLTSARGERAHRQCPKGVEFSKQ